jgi:DNA invertase Pin-like site-specific DNA recombinase
MTQQPIGYSYIRFSTPEQRKGHSLERQTEKAKEWCERHNVALDTSRTWHDLGRSAFLGDHRNNPDRRGLAAFLRLVEEDKIPPVATSSSRVWTASRANTFGPA